LENFIKEFEITNYKKFEYLKVDNLGRINLICGNNNIGKTTLLEALLFPSDNLNLIDFYHHTLCQRNIHFHVKNITTSPIFPKNNFLEYIFKDIQKPLIFRYKIQNKIESIQLEHIKISSLTQEDKNLRKDNTTIRNVLHWIKFSKNDIPNELQFLHYSDFVRTGYPNVNFLESNLNDGSEHERYKKSIAERFLELAKNTENKSKLIELLNLFTKIEDIDVRKVGDEFANRTGQISIATKENGFQPITTFGNGFIRYFSIVLGLLSSNEKVVKFAIDEIENGIHHSKLDELWSVIFNLVKEKNIQLFISTHSEECIESFSKVAKLAESEIIRKDLRILTLEHNLFNEFNTIICKTSDFEIIDNGLSNGFDFRGGLWAHD
jgi:AAA15 family ATPase/GTPase